MSGTLAIPHTFQTQSGNVPASQLDTNYSTIASYVNAREVTVGLIGARPAAGTAGRYYFATDVSGGTFYVDDGASWNQVAPGVSQQSARMTFTGQNIAAGTTNYLGVWASVTAESVFVTQLVPFAYTIRRLYIVTDVAPGAGQTFVFTLRKNAASQTLTATVADAATTANDTGNSFTGSAGDQISVQCVASAGAATMNCAVAVELLRTGA